MKRTRKPKKDPKFTMTMDLNVLNHLGLNLYSNTPAVLSEVIANSYDADATVVSIKIDKKNDTIIIEDDGHGMNLNDINSKYLNVGYQKRETSQISKKYERKFMGRKGIGKLSLFSIARDITIYSKSGKERNAFNLHINDIEEQIGKKNGSYHPREVIFQDFNLTQGTRIIITDFKKSIIRTPSFLRKRIARRFSLRMPNFQINLNGDPITLFDRDYFNKIQFLWLIGDTDEETYKSFGIKNIKKVHGDIPGSQNYKISGWIGTAYKPKDLKDNNKISILCRNKVGQEDILSTYAEGGIYASYLIGEVNAEFLDDDNLEDITTSSRQQYVENNERYRELDKYIYTVLKKIQSEWTELRNKESTLIATEGNPVIKEWFESLKPGAKPHAEKLFATIESLHFDDDTNTSKKELYKNGILAFERLRIADKLDQIKNLDSDQTIFLAGLFSDIQDIEAALYYDIANERVKIIRELDRLTDLNEQEKVLQKEIFNNLWLLNPSWERATQSSAIMEKKVKSEFDIITNKLTPEEKNSRFDIKYRTSAGKHIIIELKRYKTTYKVDPFDLAKQIKKYSTALKKLLDAIERGNESIESICIVGQSALDGMSVNEANKYLVPVNGRIITFDKLIQDSLDSYSDYLEREKEVGKIRKIIDRI